MAKRKGMSGVFGSAVDLFGLNAAGELTAIHGIGIGAAVQILGALAIEKWAPTKSKWADLGGGAAGVLTGLALAQKQPEAGKAAAVTAGVLGVAQHVRKNYLNKSADLNGVSIDQLSGFGEPQVQLSAPSFQTAPTLGAGGGNNISAMGLGGLYGATLYGGND